MFGATFNLVTRQTTVSFGTLKDGSLQINSLALNNKRRPKWHQRFVIVLNPYFVKRRSISGCLNHRILFKFYENVEPLFFRNAWRDFRLPMSALAAVVRKSFNRKITWKLDFLIGNFMLPVLMLTLEIVSLSIHYLISVWTTCCWNLKKKSYGSKYTILSFLAKKL